MKKILILIIIPDLKDDYSTNLWIEGIKNYNINWINPKFELKAIQIYRRWIIGYNYWKKIINKNDNIDIFFIRTSYILNQPYEIHNNIITIKYNEKYGHIIYKTLKCLELFQNKYDYIVRTNVNTFIDLTKLNQFIQTLNNTNVFTSPFWEGGNYPFGYFILISNDIANHIISHNLIEEWKYKDLADDYELTKIILKKYDYYILDDCDKPYTQSKKVNKYGIRFNADDIGESSNVIIDRISNAPNSIFLYRIKNISDYEYIKVYDYIMKKIDK
jgi:hypothetical protein